MVIAGRLANLVIDATTWPAWSRQIDAGRAASLHPAAAGAGGAARSLHGAIGRRRDRGRRADQPATVPGAAPFRQHAGLGRRRPACAAGRNLAGASRRAFPRRAAGIPGAGPRFAAPAAGNRRGVDRARQSSRHLSGALHAGGRDESVPLRARQRCRLYLPARRQCALRRRLSDAHFRAADRPYRPAYRGAGGHCRRSPLTAAGRRKPRDRRTRGAGA